MGVAITKNELKKEIKEQLQCDQGFINHIAGSRLLQNLQDAYEEPYGRDEQKGAMDEILGKR